MENRITALCEELQAAREAKKNLQTQLKEIEETIAQLKNDVSSAMIEQGLEQCMTGGYVYTVKQTYQVEKQCDSSELVRLFKLHHHSDLITEYVHPQNLKSFVAAELEINDELPSWLLGSVVVQEASLLSITKGKGKATEPDDQSPATEEPVPVVFTASCDNCQLKKSERCTKVRKELCSDYRAIPYIPKEERELWPEHGDATAFRLGEKRR